MTAASDITREDAPAHRYGLYKGSSHFGSLDGLRFLCIAAVLWHHSPLYSNWIDAPLGLTRGFLGVPFFFVLSGYLITTLLLREEDRDGQFSLRGFYWRRALRILPVYFLVVTLVGAYYIFVKGETQYLALWPHYYLFLSNFLIEDIPLLGISWSLSVEEQYYIIWPLLLLLFPRKFILPLLFLLIVINMLAVYGALDVVGIRAFEAGPLRIAMFSTTYTPILIGSGLAYILHKSWGFKALYPIVGHKIAPLIWFIAIIVLVQVLPATLLGWPNLILHIVMALGLASIVVREDNILAGLFQLKPIVRIGQISYGVYLYHLITMHAATVILAKLGVHNDGIVTVAYVVFAFLLSDLSFRYFEQPFLRLRYRAKKTS